MKITRRFTQANQNVFDTVEWTLRTSRITNADGSVVLEMSKTSRDRKGADGAHIREGAGDSGDLPLPNGCGSSKARRPRAFRRAAVSNITRIHVQVRS